MGFTDTSLAAAVVVMLVVVAAASSSPAELSPIITVEAVVLVGAMDGRAAFSDPRPPAVSCSFSLRFSLRACDFEYGARDASNPVSSIPRTPSQFIQSPVTRSDDVMDHEGAARTRKKKKNETAKHVSRMWPRMCIMQMSESDEQSNRIRMKKKKKKRETK